MLKHVIEYYLSHEKNVNYEILDVEQIASMNSQNALWQ